MNNLITILCKTPLSRFQTPKTIKKIKNIIIPKNFITNYSQENLSKTYKIKTPLSKINYPKNLLLDKKLQTNNIEITYKITPNHISTVKGMMDCLKESHQLVLSLLHIV